MKKNKFFNVFLVASLGVAALLAASACGGDDQASSSNIPEEKSEYLVNGFNSLDDLYATKFIGVLPTDTMRMHINGMKEFISEGQGSLIYENLQGSYHEAFMLFENSSAPEIDAFVLIKFPINPAVANAETICSSVYPFFSCAYFKTAGSTPHAPQVGAVTMVPLSAFCSATA